MTRARFAVIAALAAAAAIATAAWARPRLEPGAGIDRCDDANPCTDVLTDPVTCCPTCGRHLVTRKRRQEVERRCAAPQPRSRCRTLACGAPRPASPICVDGQCRDLNDG